MNYEIQLTPEAQNDLRSIFEYIAHDLQSVQNAAGQLDRLEKGIASLHQMPERFRAYDKEPWRSRNLRIMPVDNYLIFYIPDHDVQVFIFRQFQPLDLAVVGSTPECVSRINRFRHMLLVNAGLLKFFPELIPGHTYVGHSVP
ncbi:MAG: type II toxin-antitoxin system RelE/ParE family toxin, partial [Firmicutes bacterium]|nr:type II toxin-antitoxin system RelE/ParE family toxin [Bacillota bacterium]